MGPLSGRREKAAWSVRRCGDEEVRRAGGSEEGQSATGDSRERIERRGKLRRESERRRRQAEVAPGFGHDQILAPLPQRSTPDAFREPKRRFSGRVQRVRLGLLDAPEKVDHEIE